MVDINSLTGKIEIENRYKYINLEKAYFKSAKILIVTSVINFLLNIFSLSKFILFHVRYEYIKWKGEMKLRFRNIRSGHF